MTVAFTLFGLMIGLNATFDMVAEKARADRIFTNARFGGNGMPIAVARQIAAMPGVKVVTAVNFMPGYVQDPKNQAFVLMVDENVAKVFGDWPITPAAVGRGAEGPHRHRDEPNPGRALAQESGRHLHHDLQAGEARRWQQQLDLQGAGDRRRHPAEQRRLSSSAITIISTRPGRWPTRARSTRSIFWPPIPPPPPNWPQRIDHAFANSATPLQTITEKLARSGSDFGGLDIKAITRGIALAGMFMVLFLTGNGIAQSVRERFAEFATLKTIGFSDRAVIALVVLEAALPCILGARAGRRASRRFWRGRFPASDAAGLRPSAAHHVAHGDAVGRRSAPLLVALLSAALPILRLTQMDIATALSGRT